MDEAQLWQFAELHAHDPNVHTKSFWLDVNLEIAKLAGESDEWGWELYSDFIHHLGGAAVIGSVGTELDRMPAPNPLKRQPIYPTDRRCPPHSDLFSADPFATV